VSAPLRRLAPYLLLLVASVLCLPASAASCTVSSNGLAFGSYDPVSATATSSTGFMSVTCTPSCTVNTCTQAFVTVSLTKGSSGSYTLRTMKQGSAKLGYNIYTKAGGTTVFGDGSGVSSTITYCVPVAGSPCVNATYTGTSGQPFSIPAYGQITAHQDVASGAYVDSLTVTVAF
jgi:spore coat protein U-like protein